MISPEGCASILWKDASRVKEAAESLRLTAEDLLEFGVIERIVKEPEDFSEIYVRLREQIYETVSKHRALPVETLLDNRYKRFRKLGVREA